LISVFQEHFRSASKISAKFAAAVGFVGIFVGIEGQTFTANFAIPNEGIEQTTRKNDGACAKPKQRRRARFRILEPRYSRSVWST
jgi:hypothetical protein